MYFFFNFFSVVLGIEPRALLVLHQCAQPLSYIPSPEYLNL